MSRVIKSVIEFQSDEVLFKCRKAPIYNGGMFLQDYLVAGLIRLCQWKNVLWICESLGFTEYPKRVTHRSSKQEQTTALITYNFESNHLPYFDLKMWLKACARGLLQLALETKFGLVGVVLVTVVGVYRIYKRRQLEKCKLFRGNSRERQREPYTDTLPRQAPTKVWREVTHEEEATTSSDIEESKLLSASTPQKCPFESVPTPDCFNQPETRHVLDTPEISELSESALDELLPLMTVRHIVNIDELYLMLSVQSCEEIQKDVFLLKCTLSTGQTDTVRLAVTPVTKLNQAMIRDELTLLQTIRKTFVGEHAQLNRHLPFVKEVVALRDTLAKLSVRRNDAFNDEKDYVAVLSQLEPEIIFPNVSENGNFISVLISILEQANLSMAIMRSAMPGIALFSSIALVSWPINVTFQVEDRSIVIPTHGVLVKHCLEVLRLGTSLADFQFLASDILRNIGIEGVGDNVDVQYCAKILFSLGATTPLDKLIDWRARYFQAKGKKLPYNYGNYKKYAVPQ